MKIEIRHLSNTFNYGSFMMGISIINKLKDEFKDIEIYIDANRNDNRVNIERIVSETGIDDIYYNDRLIIKNIFKRYINKLGKMLMDNKKDIVIVIGGDDISEYYGIEGLLNILSTTEHETKFNKVFLLGQTIGPFTKDRGELAKNKLLKTKIYTRDDKCFKYLKDLNFTNVSKGRDLAFLPLPMQYKAKHILSKYKLVNNKYITVVISGLTECYTSNLENYIMEQVNILNYLLNNSKLENKKIVLLPHVVLPVKVDDRLVIKEVMKRLDKYQKERIIAIDDEMLASEAREILGNGLLTVTGRMHAAVSTFYMRKPAVSLSYSVKYSGVIGDGLDMNELVIEATGDKLWGNNEISKFVDEKVNYILDNYEDLVKKIDFNVKKTSEITEKQLDDLVNSIKKLKGIK